MREPHEYFIRYLISLGLGYEEVNGSLREYQLPQIDREYHQHLAADMVPPEDFQPTSKEHFPSMRYLIQHGIQELWFQKEFPQVEQTFQILKNSLLRRMVETLSLSRMPHSEIALGLEQKYKAKMPTKAVEYVIKFFSN